MAKLETITGKVIGGEWGFDDELGTGIPVLRTTNFTNDGFINFDDVTTRTITKKDLTDKYLQPGDIIIEKSGGSDKQPVGRVVFYEGMPNKYLFNNFTGVLRVINSSCWVSKYLFYALYSNYLKGGTRKYQNKTTGLHNLKTEQYVKEFEVFERPVWEQHEIVVTLDRICNLISLRKQQLSKLDELVKSRFIEMFGDCDLSHSHNDWRLIIEIGRVIGGATPKTNIDEYWNGEYRWITPAELDADSGYIYDSVRKLTKAGVESCSLQEMPINTVILTSRAPIGKLAIAGDTFYCNQGFKNIICKEEIIPIYLYTLLLMNTEYLNSLGRGATFKEISKSILENIKIPVPPIEQQNKFAVFVKQVDKSKFEIQKSLEKLETLKKALMQKYFG